MGGYRGLNPVLAQSSFSQLKYQSGRRCQLLSICPPLPILALHGLEKKKGVEVVLWKRMWCAWVSEEQRLAHHQVKGAGFGMPPQVPQSLGLVPAGSINKYHVEVCENYSTFLETFLSLNSDPVLKARFVFSHILKQLLSKYGVVNRKVSNINSSHSSIQFWHHQLRNL